LRLVHTRKFTVKTESLSALETAKAERRTLAASVKEAIGLGAAKAAVWDLSEARVRDVEERRAAAVAANKPADVLRISDELPDAEAERECAEADAVAHKLRLTDLVAALRAAEAAVTVAAKSQLLAEMIDLAAKFNRAFDSAMQIGAQLQALALGDPLRRPLSGPGSEVPPTAQVIEQALARIPRPDERHVPLHILRTGGASSDAWASRLAALIAYDEPTPNMEVAA
jgi:hypothetical protein